ncbi:unnamed protein product, partial [Symbiodinium pilosum]
MGRAASTGSPGSLQAMVRGPSRSPTPERTTGGKSPAMPTAGAIAGAEAQSARLVIMDPKEARARARTQTLAAEAEIVVATGPTYSSRSKPPQRLPKRLWAPSEATDANDLLSQAFQVRRDTFRASGADATPHPHHGRRIGEAAHPGPEQLPDAMQRRSRVLHALAQMRLREPPEDPAEIATITSETLSAHTPFASPRHSPSPARIIIRSPEPASPARTELPAPSPRMLVPGDTAPTQVDDATPGHTPPRSPVPQVSPPALLRWHETRPPTSNPGERCSWLYVPLLHAAAGFLSESAYAAWSGEPEIGERWLAMVVALRNAPPSLPQVLANAMHTVAELEARHAEEQAVADLLALPPHPLPLPTA